MTIAIQPRAVDAAAATAAETICAHCGLAVPPALVEEGAEHQFCCAGCRVIFATLREHGLEAYYDLREAAGATGARADAVAVNGRFAAFDDPSFRERYVNDLEDGRASCDLLLEGVTCAACVWLVEKLPRLCPGVTEARLSLRDRTARVTWRNGEARLSDVARAISRLGYKPLPPRASEREAMARREERRRLIDIGIAGVCAGNGMLLAFAIYAGELSTGMERVHYQAFLWLSAFFGIIALAWPGRTFFRGALAALRARTANLDLPIAVALAIGGAAGLVNTVLGRGEIYFDSLNVLVFLLLVGRFIQHRQHRRAAEAVGLMASLVPSACRKVEPDGTVRDVPVESLSPGDVAEVLPGEVVPADGEVVAVSGDSTEFDQALLTGESEPVKAGVGTPAWAGSRNVVSSVRVRVTQAGEASRVGRLMRDVERATGMKAPVVQFADRVAGVFVVLMILLAAATLAWWSVLGMLGAGIDHAVALLIVACPCALGLATPLTLSVALGNQARRNILVKGASAIELLSRGGRLVLDKTGTLTEGRVDLVEWHGDGSLRPLVALAERSSGHHLGKAVVRAWGNLEASAQQRAQVSRGEITERGDGGLMARFGGDTLHVGSAAWARRQGVRVSNEMQAVLDRYAEHGYTPVVAGWNGVARLALAFGDRDRADAAGALERLRRAGWTIEVQSGDVEPVVKATARRLGLDPCRAAGGVTPEAKLARVIALAEAGARVVMVGDGVNDAGALAAAGVGVAVAGGAEASLAAADVYIARPGLMPLVELVEDSRRAMRAVRRNLCVSLAYNTVGVTLAMTGLITPLTAAILMPISSVTVVFLALGSGVRRRRPARGSDSRCDDISASAVLEVQP